MVFFPKRNTPVKEVRRFLVIFYIVGTLGFLLPFTQKLFIAITPFALLLNVYLLAIYHKAYNAGTIAVFLFVFLAGFFIEVIGVKTGCIFGHYEYASGLGLKLFDTPLLIGVNWLFLSYASTSVLSRVKLPRVLYYLVPPVLMLVYDLVLEQVAPKMDMWYWDNDKIPLQNYLAWFLIAFLFTSLIKLFNIDTENGLAKVLLLCQFVFFVLLMLILR